MQAAMYVVLCSIVNSSRTQFPTFENDKEAMQENHGGHEELEAVTLVKYQCHLETCPKIFPSRTIFSSSFETSENRLPHRSIEEENLRSI